MYINFLIGFLVDALKNYVFCLGLLALGGRIFGYGFEVIFSTKAVVIVGMICFLIGSVIKDLKGRIKEILEIIKNFREINKVLEAKKKEILK